MKNSEIRQLSTKELEERIEDEKNVFARLKLNHAVSPLDNPLKIKFTRRNIARLETEHRKRIIEETNKTQ
ncbi:MAG: 50S ribosomal protein L29 [Bacteroidetes bacterium]|nr:50S ribosomal protein L29 [Bacteroidota bacterium]